MLPAAGAAGSRQQRDPAFPREASEGQAQLSGEERRGLDVLQLHSAATAKKRRSDRQGTTSSTGKSAPNDGISARNGKAEGGMGSAGLMMDSVTLKVFSNPNGSVIP